MGLKGISKLKGCFMETSRMFKYKKFLKDIFMVFSNSSQLPEQKKGMFY